MVTCNHEIATMPHIAQTPTAPYYAVIFTSVRTEREDGYEITAQRDGRDIWYRDYKIRIARVERDYGLTE